MYDYQLSRSAICDPSVLKHGVRYIFSLDGALVTDVSQLHDGECFVCSSYQTYKPLDYTSIQGVDWVSTSRKVSTPSLVTPTESFVNQLNQKQSQHRRNYGT